MNIEDDIARLAIQEDRLQFERFDAAMALDIGLRIKAAAESKGVAVAIEVFLNGPLFYFSMPGRTFDNAEWLRRKRNVALRWQKSSYAVGLGFQQRKVGLDRYGLPTLDYAPHGGSFPIRLRGTPAVIGTIGVSGLAEREDHALVVEVLAAQLGVPLADIALST